MRQVYPDPLTGLTQIRGTEGVPELHEAVMAESYITNDNK
jgi:hypothetical protein